jgi:hypothetical protein
MLILLGACQNIGEDVQGTLTTGDLILETEAAAIQQGAVAQRTTVAGTVAVAETQIAAESSVNDQLFMTLAAGSTPTVSLIAGQADPSSAGEMDAMGNAISPVQADSGRLFVQTGISNTVSSADSCVLNPDSIFDDETTEQLYATAQVFNASNTAIEMRAEWYHEGELVTSDNWTMSPNGSPYCFYFVIDRNDTDFPPGTWRVEMFAGNFTLRDLTMSFVIES